MLLRLTGLDRVSKSEIFEKGFPYYNQAKTFFTKLEQEDGWIDWCIENNVFHFYTEEYSEALSIELNNADESLREEPRGLFYSNKIIEIGAGSGLLSLGLQRHKTDILPTDIKPKSKFVEKLSAIEALQKYKPAIVVGAWLPFDANIELEILGYESVKYFFYICQFVNGIAGNEKTWRSSGWDIRPLLDADKFSISRYDFINPKGEIVKHSKTFLFKKKISF